MASERKTCKASTCHRKFSRPLGSRREYCETCRPPRKPRPVEAPPVVPIGPGECERAVRGELERAGRAETVDGVLACRLARQLDGTALTGAQAASLTRELRALMAAAMAGVAPAEDFVDEMARRRQQRVGA